MASLFQRLTRKQRLLGLWAVAFVLILAVVATYADLPLGDLPLPSRVEQQEKKLTKLQRRLADLEEQRRAHEARLAELRAKAAPFWDVGSRTATAEVRTELDKLLRHGQVTAQNIRLLNDKPEKFSECVLSVEISLQLRTTMREVTRLMAELESADRPFYWTQCTLHPDPPQDPKQVNLNGRLQALLLSPDTAKFLYGNRRAP